MKRKGFGRLHEFETRSSTQESYQGAEKYIGDYIEYFGLESVDGRITDRRYAPDDLALVFAEYLLEEREMSPGSMNTYVNGFRFYLSKIIVCRTAEMTSRKMHSLRLLVTLQCVGKQRRDLMIEQKSFQTKHSQTAKFAW